MPCCALSQYVSVKESILSTGQLFVCFGGGTAGALQTGSLSLGGQSRRDGVDAAGITLPASVKCRST